MDDDEMGDSDVKRSIALGLFNMMMMIMNVYIYYVGPVVHNNLFDGHCVC